MFEISLTSLDQGFCRKTLRSLPYVLGDPRNLPPCPAELQPLPRGTSWQPCIGSQLMTHLPPTFYENMEIGSGESSRKGWKMQERCNQELRIDSISNGSLPRSIWTWFSDGQLIQRKELPRMAKMWSERAKLDLDRVDLDEGCTVVCMDPVALPSLFDAQAYLDTASTVDCDTEDHQSDFCGFFLLPGGSEEEREEFQIDATTPCALIQEWNSRLVASLMGDVKPEHLPAIKTGVEAYSALYDMPKPWTIAIWGNEDPEMTQAWTDMGGQAVDRISTPTTPIGHMRYAFVPWGPEVEMSRAESWSFMLN